MSLSVENITPGIGGEVTGIDLACATRDEMAEVQEALDDRAVLVFRDQELSREEHKRLGSFFGVGELHRHRLAGARGPDPEVWSSRRMKNRSIPPVMDGIPTCRAIRIPLSHRCCMSAKFRPVAGAIPSSPA